MERTGGVVLAACFLIAGALPARAQQTASAETPIHVLGIVEGPDGEARIECRRHVGESLELGDASAINRIARDLFEPVPDVSAVRWHDADVFVALRSPPEKAGRQAATFQVEYSGFSSEARAAFQHAVDLWSTWIESNVTIRIEASWSSLDDNVLGSAGPTYFDSANTNDTWFVPALSNAIRGRDGDPDEVDIRANFNSDFDNWYFGLDGETPSRTIDFVTVVVHEIGHGLGFLGSMKVDDGSDDEEEECGGLEDAGCWGFSQFPDIPVIYDRFAEDSRGNRLANTSNYPNPSTALGDVLEGGPVRFAGAAARAAYAGARPPLFAPDDWEKGSSYSHLDESTFGAGDPSSLMSPSVASSEAIHDPGPVGCAIFADIGWTTTSACGTADSAVPVVPDVLHPEDGDIQVEIPTEFAWSEAAEADYYELQVARDSTFSDVAVDSSRIDTTRIFIHDLEAAATYFWRVRAINDEGISVWTLRAEFATILDVSDRDDADADPFGFAAYPNPFHDRVNLEFMLPGSRHVQLTVFDVQGRRVGVVLDERLRTGLHTVRWRPTGLPSGVYLFRLDADGKTSTRKIIFLQSGD